MCFAPTARACVTARLLSLFQVSRDGFGMNAQGISANRQARGINKSGLSLVDTTGAADFQREGYGCSANSHVSPSTKFYSFPAVGRKIRTPGNGIVGFRGSFTFRNFGGEAVHFVGIVLTEGATLLEIAQHFESTPIPAAGLAHIPRISAFLREHSVDGT